MSTRKKLLIAAIGIAVIGVLVCLLIASKSPASPQPLVAVQSNQGQCSQCIAANCYQAPCNLECRLVGPDNCETIVMGGGDGGAYSPSVKAANGDYAEFFLQQIRRPTRAMTEAKLEIGDTVTHVNNQWADSQLKFAELVLTLPKGTTMRGVRKNGESFFVTL